jgi:hypothetical protein
VSYSMSIIDIAKLMHPPKGAELARAPGAKQERQETGHSCLKSGIDFSVNVICNSVAAATHAPGQPKAMWPSTSPRLETVGLSPLPLGLVQQQFQSLFDGEAFGPRGCLVPVSLDSFRAALSLSRRRSRTSISSGNCLPQSSRKSSATFSARCFSQFSPIFPIAGSSDLMRGIVARCTKVKF